MLRDVLGRIERRLKALGISATRASKDAGLTEDAIRNMRRAMKDDAARTGVSTTTLNALAPVLGTSVGWLMTGEGPETDATDSGVPLIGYVGAGSEAHFYASSDVLDIVPRPRGSTDRTVATEIRGTSLGPAFERWLIYFDDVRSPVTEDLFGRLCVVGLPDDRVLVKLIRPAATPNHFHLLSNSGEEPILDQEVVWAASVKTISPR